ncbi:hypothetical protein HI914_02681 [Erysiphe necator]|nr:hypothetical protein HI914_02681 [Erysiphe necator]
MNSTKRVLNNRDDDRIVVEDPTLDESDSERPHKTKSPNHKAAQALKSVETGKLHHFEKLLDLTETNRKQSTPPATFREHSNKNSKILSNKTTLPERSNINQEDSPRSQPPITFSPLKRNSVTEPVTVGQSSLDPITLYYKAQQEKIDQEKKIFEAEKLAFEEKLHHSQDKTIKTAPSSDRVINDPLLNNHNENHSHESPTSKKLDHDSYTKPLNREQTIKSVKEKVKAMNEIVGCRGKGPVDFVFILEQIKMIEGEKRIDRNFTHWCLQYENNHVLNSWQIQTTITDLKYENEIWYRDVWRLITLSQYPPNSDKIEQRRLLNKSSKYMILKDELFKSVGHGNWRKCVTKSEVAEILQLAHDFGGHYVHTLTMKKLSKYWWPDKSKNCYKYILGCLECAEHGTKRRSETQSPVYVDQPNVLMDSQSVISPPPYKTK